MKFKQLCDQLEAKIQNSYEEGVTLETAERLAAEFLYAQMQVSNQLKAADLNARMQKSGVKAIRAAIYLDIIQKNEKKPTEAQITATIDTDKIVAGEQQNLDLAEVEKAELERYYDIFVNGHIYFRGIAKGKFE
jgi:hypothetical protein